MTKNLRSLLALVALLPILFACNTYDYVVESDYSYKGNFKKYATFKFMKDVATNPTEPYISEIMNEQIRRRMELQGYEYDESKPHLLVSYKIFRSDLDFTGYNQIELEKWIDKNFLEDEYDPVKYSLYKGTILVIFYDRRRRTSVWQGYASSILGGDEFNNDRYLSQAVRSIFDQYKVFTEDRLLDKYN